MRTHTQPLKHFGLLLLLSSSAAACWEEDVELTRTRRNVALPGVSTVAVGTIHGHGGEDVSDLLRYELRADGGIVVADGADAGDAHTAHIHGRILCNTFRLTASPDFASSGFFEEVVQSTLWPTAVAEVVALLDASDAQGRIIASRRVRATVRGTPNSLAHLGENSLRIVAYEKLAEATAASLSEKPDRSTVVMYGSHDKDSAAAIEHCKKGEWNDALAFYREALRASQSYVRSSAADKVYHNLAVALAYSGALEESIELLQERVRRRSDAPQLGAPLHELLKRVQGFLEEEKKLGVARSIEVHATVED